MLTIVLELPITFDSSVPPCSFFSNKQLPTLWFLKMGKLANKFFKAKGKSRDFKIIEYVDGTYRFEYWDPANTPGWRKYYIQEIDSNGALTLEYADTVAPGGLHQRKIKRGSEA